MDEQLRNVMAALERGEAMTNGEVYGTAVEKVHDPITARLFMLALVKNHVERWGGTVADAIIKEKSNLGYHAGYYSQAEASRVYELFECSHPIFGRSFPSPDEAFKKGLELGRAARLKAENP